MSEIDELLESMSVDERERFLQDRQAVANVMTEKPVTVEALKSTVGPQPVQRSSNEREAVSSTQGVLAAEASKQAVAINPRESLKRLTEPVKYREALIEVMSQNAETRAANLGLIELMGAEKRLAGASNVQAIVNGMTEPKVSNLASKFRYVMEGYPGMSAKQVFENVQGIDPQIVLGKLAEQPKEVLESRETLREATKKIYRELNGDPKYQKFRDLRESMAPASEQIKHVGLQQETLHSLQQISFPVAFGEIRKSLTPTDAKLAEMNIYHEARGLSTPQQFLVMQTTLNRALGHLQRDGNGQAQLPMNSITKTVLAPKQFSWANNGIIPEKEAGAAEVAKRLWKVSMNMYDQDVAYALAADNGASPGFGKQPSYKLSRLKTSGTQQEAAEGRLLPENGLMKQLGRSGFTGLNVAYYHTNTTTASWDQTKKASEETNKLLVKRGGHFFREGADSEYAVGTMRKLGTSSRSMTESGLPSEAGQTGGAVQQVKAETVVGAPLFQTRGAANAEVMSLQRARQASF